MGGKKSNIGCEKIAYMGQKSYGKTARFKIFDVKKVVPLGILVLGQTRAQRQLLQK